MDIKEKYGITDLDYFKSIDDIIKKDIVKSMDKYIQHGNTSTLEHSINVSYLSYKLAKKLNYDFISVARGALLHDFYLYDWHTNKSVQGIFKQHGFVHSKKALTNAQNYFKLNKLEKDIILKHMWPLTITLIPKYKESILVSIVDKGVSSKEFVSYYWNQLKELFSKKSQF